MALQPNELGSAPAVDPPGRPLRLLGTGAVAAVRRDALAAALGFAFPFALGVGSGGYWPTAWGWAAMAFFWICTLVLLLDSGARLRPLEAVLPGALLALVAWDLVSSLWSSSLTQPILEAQLALLYAGAALACLLVVRNATYPALLGGATVAITLVCVYSLATRLFPERLGVIDEFADYRLAEPLGYWNALGMFAALGTIAALGFAARGRSHVIRALAGASIAILVPTLYFTFSRGAWIALALGVAALVAADRARLQLLATALVIAPWAAVAVWVASRSDPLTHQGTRLAAAAHAGHRYAVELCLLVAAAAAATLVLSLLSHRLAVPPRVALAFGGALVLAAAALLAAGFLRFGSPVTIARHAYDSFLVKDRPSRSRDLNHRLLTLANTGRIQWWRIAWRDYTNHPWLGSGSGSYKRYWDQLRPAEVEVRDAHNLYLETLAETGPVGLSLLLGALFVPLAGLLRARRTALGAVAAGAYVAFLGEAAVDWDWEMPAVTVTALFCAVALLVAGRREGESVGLRRPVALAGIVVSLALGGFAFVGLQGNRAVAASEDARSESDWAKGVSDARRAIRWAPWSAHGWQLLGEAQYGLRQTDAARRSFLKALSKDRADWSIWLDLAVVSQGATQRHALAEATKLNPLSSEIAGYRALVRSRKGRAKP